MTTAALPLLAFEALEYGVKAPPARLAPGPMVHCEACAWRYYAALRLEIAPGNEIVFELHPRDKSAPRAPSFLKPSGQPCPVCGDNSPAGTYPWNGPTCARVSPENGEPSTVLHGRGCQCRGVATTTESAA